MNGTLHSHVDGGDSRYEKRDARENGQEHNSLEGRMQINENDILAMESESSSNGSGENGAASHESEGSSENDAALSEATSTLAIEPKAEERGEPASKAAAHAPGQNGVAEAAKNEAELSAKPDEMEEEAGASDDAGATAPAATAPPASSARRSWRVKLYQLNSDGQWDDRGTGNVVCKNVESLGATALCLSKENAEGDELLCSRIVDEDVYMRQGDNIITWSETLSETSGTGLSGSSGSNVDLALSFQENEGCVDIWNRICDVQGRHSDDARSLGSAMDVVNGGSDGRSDATLPEPRLGNLQAMVEALSGLSPSGKDAVVTQLLADDEAYVRRLLAIFSDAEDLEDENGLRGLCAVMKAIVALNDAALLERLLADRHFPDVAGIFEYDPELREPAKHREFLTKTARFRQVIEIEDEAILKKIHQNFRISFLKDQLLRPMLDDQIVGTLANLAYHNSADIVSTLGSDTDYTQRVLELMEKPDLSREKRAEALGYLKELFAMARTVQATAREQLYRNLWTHAPLFDVLVPVLKDPTADLAERSAVMEILLSVLSHDPSLLRLHIVRRGSHPPPPPQYAAGASRAGNNGSASSGGGGLLHSGSSGGSGPEAAGKVAKSTGECESLLFWLLRRLATDQDLGVLVQAAEVVKLLLDTDTMETANDRDAFLGAFYDHYIFWLAEPLSDIEPFPIPPPTRSSSADAASGAADALAVASLGSSRLGEEESHVAKASKGHAVELLSFCVRTHTYRMKYFVLRNGVAMRVLRLLRYRDGFLQLTAVRFMKACISMKDEFYNRYIAKNNLLAPLLGVMWESADRDNLLNSAIADMIEFIRVENIRSLADYICERLPQPVAVSITHPTCLAAAMYAALQRRYDQNHDQEDPGQGGGDSGSGGGVFGAGGLGASSRGNGGGGAGAGGSSARNSRWGGQRRRLADEDEDEAYFDGPDDDATSVPTGFDPFAGGDFSFAGLARRREEPDREGSALAAAFDLAARSATAEGSGGASSSSGSGSGSSGSAAGAAAKGDSASAGARLVAKVFGKGATFGGSSSGADSPRPSAASTKSGDAKEAKKPPPPSVADKEAGLKLVPYDSDDSDEDMGTTSAGDGGGGGGGGAAAAVPSGEAATGGDVAASATPMPVVGESSSSDSSGSSGGSNSGSGPAGPTTHSPAANHQPAPPEGSGRGVIRKASSLEAGAAPNNRPGTPPPGINMGRMASPERRGLLGHSPSPPSGDGANRPAKKPRSM